MKIFYIGNVIYLPLDNNWNNKISTKYMKGSISGELFPSTIVTEEEIREEWGSGIKEVRNLHELTAGWGNRI